MVDAVDDTLGELREIARYSRRPDLRDEGRDKLIRFLDTHASGGAAAAIVDSLCVHFGLFPYVSPNHDDLSTAEALEYEFHRPNTKIRDAEFVFHADQATI